jgi:hypothetical protein
VEVHRQGSNAQIFEEEGLTVKPGTKQGISGELKVPNPGSRWFWMVLVHSWKNTCNFGMKHDVPRVSIKPIQ